MAGSNIFNTQFEDEDLLFWVVVQACRDIVHYNVPANGRYPLSAFLHAKEWILDDLPQQIGDREYTFREALEAIGVHPNNVEIIRETIARGPCTLYEEKQRLAREAYARMDGQDNEPEPFWRCVQNLILNKEPDLDYTVQESED
jgi:hypothetical protein